MMSLVAVIGAVLSLFVLPTGRPDVSGDWEVCLTTEGRKGVVCGRATVGIESTVAFMPNDSVHVYRFRHDLALTRSVGEYHRKLDQFGLLRISSDSTLAMGLGLGAQDLEVHPHSGALVARLTWARDSLFGEWRRVCNGGCPEFGRVVFRRKGIPGYTSRHDAIAWDSASIRGRIYDTLTSLPIQHSRICGEARPPQEWRYARCTRPDTLGWFTLRGLPAGSNFIWAACDGLIERDGRTLDTVTVQLVSGEVKRLDSRGTIGSCDTRPLRTVHREFAGHYSRGFGISDFVPCPGQEWLLPADTAGTGGPEQIWVAWSSPEVRSVMPANWPAAQMVEDPDRSYFNYFVRWTGVLRGPDSFGPRGYSTFEFVPDSVIELRAARQSDCAGVASRDAQ